MPDRQGLKPASLAAASGTAETVPSQDLFMKPVLATFSRPMTRALFRTAVAGLRQLAIWTNASLGVQAPEQAVVAGRHRRIGLGENELSFPAQRRTQVRMIDVEALRFPNHAAPPDAAFMMALVTATRASFTL